MAIRTFGIASFVVDSGGVNLRFVGSKSGRSWGSLAALREDVRQARERDADHRLLLAIGEALKADPGLANVKALESVTFEADDGR